ncbi:PIN domain-containing protein [Streptomyces albus]|uniref:PIN domain-containing protein n=1 Tax=Streptomyces albus TaxID=1888 RepID=UPI00068A8EBF|nr:PIN domain-containing protein [Streptomyces albus]
MAGAFVVYDAGALVAAQRKQGRFCLLHQTFVAARRTLLVPVPVYVQVYRADPRQHGLHVVLKAAELHRADREIADLAARALRETGTDDAVDAIVAATAVVHRAPVVTGDEGDIRSLLEALDAFKHPVLAV